MQWKERLLRATVLNSLGVFPKAIIDILCFSACTVQYTAWHFRFRGNWRIKWRESQILDGIKSQMQLYPSWCQFWENQNYNFCAATDKFVPQIIYNVVSVYSCICHWITVLAILEHYFFLLYSFLSLTNNIVETKIICESNLFIWYSEFFSRRIWNLISFHFKFAKYNNKVLNYSISSGLMFSFTFN